MKYKDNMLLYLKWRGDIPMEAVPLNYVDSMILCQFVYLNFADIVPSCCDIRTISVRDAARRYRMRYLDSVPESDYTMDEELLFALAESERFGHLRLSAYAADTDAESVMQFAAMQIDLDGEKSYLAFRGTDGTVVGWKENFKLCYLRPVPAQQRAVEYVQRTVDPQRYYCFGGHSKGGNLAVYAAAYGGEAVRERLFALHTFDSPGYFWNLWEEPEFAPLQDRFAAFMPESSVVGTLLYHAPQARVVKSSESGLSQHLLQSWLVDGPDFVYLPDRDRSSYLMEDNLREGIGRIPMEERELFVEAFFSYLESLGIERFSELRSMTPPGLVNALKGIRTVSPEKRETILRIVRMIAGDPGAELSVGH